MFVLMDMEWIINDRGHICPILIAALRVTDQWISRDSFYERMRPKQLFLSMGSFSSHGW